MRKVLALSALTFALCLSACSGPLARTPDPATAREVSGTPAPAVAAPFDLVTDAAMLAKTGLSITLVGRELILKETTTRLNVQFRLPDGTVTYPQALTHELHREASVGLVVLVGQAVTEPVATVTLKPRPVTGTGTLTPAQ
ncbi:hypothetical protein [Deinococcus gobiensis]|uniref:Lipoprotein n=1 Tax=Deinococcus gobiensis (strain DSM 21396 / JCM 16679 / CGMCC 1.7299 / I-0) TaxID=745776 RepID=H8H2H7_DEIGI|nr:hypothetical protein [Deinococcus gobiensis]AFD27724.1 hypothetical protein DGo_PB0455 [Deinococcus gobiensis I-0]